MNEYSIINYTRQGEVDHNIMTLCLLCKQHYLETKTWPVNAD